MTKKQTSEKQVAKDSGYDEFPYYGYPFDYTRPENLKSVGRLFNIKAPKLEKARILELGCSDGGNIFRFADEYPKSYTLGVDLSKTQIDLAQKTLKETGLKNIEFKHMSITDLDESYGKFDYIICHGVFSWVPEFVRDGIFEVSKKLLNKNGLVFVSYNTLPGWNMMNTIKEMMLYHAKSFKTDQDKVSQGKAILSFIQQSLEGQESAYAKFMKIAVNDLSKKEDQYIRHEYLEDDNVAFYFHEFVEKARAKGLEYVADTDVHRMYTGNLPQKTMEKLTEVKDIVRTEQYIDFINNSPFRCTILTHRDTPISRNITNEQVEAFNYFSDIYYAQDANLQDDSEVEFINRKDQNRTMKSSAPVMKSILASLAQNIGNPLSFKEIIEYAHKLAPKISKDEIKANVLANFPRLIFSGMVKYLEDKPKSVFNISSKPKVSNLARQQVKEKKHNGRHWITNSLNQVVIVEDYQVGIVEAMDGKNTIDEIKAKTLQDLKDGKFIANEDGKKIEDEEKMKAVCDALVNQTLENFRISYVLIG